MRIVLTDFLKNIILYEFEYNFELCKKTKEVPNWMTFNIKIHLLVLLPVLQQNLEQRRIQQEAASREVGQSSTCVHHLNMKRTVYPKCFSCIST